MHSKSRCYLAALTTSSLLVFALAIVSAQAQVKTRLSVATGGTGGVYYPLGGGLDALISKHLPGVEAILAPRWREGTAEGVVGKYLMDNADSSSWIGLPWRPALRDGF
jgi:hypothetical protein